MFNLNRDSLYRDYRNYGGPDIRVDREFVRLPIDEEKRKEIYDFVIRDKEQRINIPRDYKTVCNSERDPVTDDLYDDDSVQIYSRKQDIGKPNKAECYLRNTLREWFKQREIGVPPVTEWKRRSDGSIERTHRLYKLPISGSWITGMSAKLLVCSKYKVFVVAKEQDATIGSQLGVSRLHGAIENVKTLKPVDRMNGNHIIDCDIQDIIDMKPHRVRYIEKINDHNVSNYITDIDMNNKICELDSSKGCVMMFKSPKTKKRVKRSGTKKPSAKKFLYNPNSPKKSFDVYIDKNPKDTISIKYTTLKDVKDTIKKLERLYKSKKYTHKRIWQVGMIMMVRLRALKSKKPKHYALANRYFKFLGSRTKLKGDARYKSKFHLKAD